MVLLGDWNTNFVSKHSTIPECKQLESLFTQIIKKPTRVTAESRTMIYLIATNHRQNIKDSGVITSTSLSDHEMSFCVRKINWKKTLLQQKTFRNYANYNPEKFLKDLKNTDFDLPSGNVNNVNELWQSFKEKFTNIAERHAAAIVKCVRGLNNCPWLNTSISRLEKIPLTRK